MRQVLLNFKEWRENITLSKKTVEQSFQEGGFHKETPFCIKKNSKGQKDFKVLTEPDHEGDNIKNQ